MQRKPAVGLVGCTRREQERARARAIERLKMNILIVDDQSDFRVMLATFLEDAGYTVAGAANGREALSYLYCCAELPGLILLDVAMPLMTGWDFLSIQQGNAAIASIPVVMLSARGNSRHDGLDCRPAAYLQKPIDLNNLLGAIRQHYALSEASTR
jgi:two-component system, chemotaxis family, chemotaxis protein CheY